MEENKTTITFGCKEVNKGFELIVPYGMELFVQDGKVILIDKKPKYPKTYGECCEILMGKTDFQDFELVLTKLSITTSYENTISPEPPYITKINKLYKLLICRDAYWEIAGGWKPDWEEYSGKYCIIYLGGVVQVNTYFNCSRILSFPTKEMRDAFYENFKDLIESCKELL